MTRKRRKDKIFDRKMEQFVSSVKKHEKVNEQEMNFSWALVENLAYGKPERKKEGKRIRYVFAGLSVVASIAVLFVILFYSLRPVAEPSMAESGNIIFPADSSNQIRLILSDNRQVELENESVISYDKKGGITVNNESSRTVEKVIGKADKLNHIVVPKGRRTYVNLSDGTKMYVNADSHVVYPSVFDGDTREIVVEGEVYLEVARNPQVPFVVKANGLDVKVLGTIFNVSAYKEQEVSVVLVAGSVEVKSFTEGKILLSPSQMVRFKDGIMTKEDVDVTKYICWKDNVMLLDNDPVGHVLDKLSRYYGIPIWYEASVAGRKLSGKLDLCESIDDVLAIVNESASLHIEDIEGGGFYFTKEK